MITLMLCVIDFICELFSNFRNKGVTLENNLITQISAESSASYHKNAPINRHVVLFNTLSHLATQEFGSVVDVGTAAFWTERGTNLNNVPFLL